MDAPKLNPQESLKESFPKLNRSIDNANEALNKADSAFIKSDSAISTSNKAYIEVSKALESANEASEIAKDANVKADGLQGQIDELVISGDSSPEAAQARTREDGTSFPTLQKRLNNSDGLLFQTSAESVQYNNISYPYQVYRSLALKNMNRLLEKIKRNLGFTIACRGDSLTYGEDNVVDKRAADPNPTPEGRIHTALRANTTYPEALKEYLSLVKDNVVVVNQGYSGDNTKKGFEDWTTDIGSDLTIMMYGKNDSSFGWSPYQTVDNFIFYYEKIIIRELLRGSAVILMKPPKVKSATDFYIETYREALSELGKKYGLTVLDCTEFLINDDSSVFSDDVHFKSIGYRKIASKVTAFLLGNVSKPLKVKRGSTVLTREEFDSIDFKGYTIAMSDPNAMTPPLDSWQGGYLAKTTNSNSVFIWSFYAEEDDLIVLPTLYVSRCIARYELDFGLEQPQYSLDDRVGHTTYSNQYGTTDKPSAYLEIDSGINTALHANRELPRGHIHIATKGWHTIKLTIKFNGTNTDPVINNQGLSFMGYEEYVLWYNYFKKFKGYYYGLTHSSWNSSPATVTSTSFKRQEVLDNLKIDETNTDPFKNPVLRITVTSYEKGVIEYLWLMGTNTDNAKAQLVQKDMTLFGNSVEADLRKINSITYNNSQYIINWSGKTNVISNFVITPY